MTSYFPSNKNVKFVLHWRPFDYQRIYYNKYIESYDVKEKSILLREWWSPIISKITEPIDRIEIESKATKQNFYMFILHKLLYEDLRAICSHEKFNHSRLYTFDIDERYIIHSEVKMSKDCTKRRDGTIFDYDHFFKEVNELVCN